MHRKYQKQSTRYYSFNTYLVFTASFILTISHFTVTLNNIYSNFYVYFLQNIGPEPFRTWYMFVYTYLSISKQIYIYVCRFLVCSKLSFFSCGTITTIRKRINRLKSNFKFNLVYSNSNVLFVFSFFRTSKTFLASHFYPLAV